MVSLRVALSLVTALTLVIAADACWAATVAADGVAEVGDGTMGAQQGGWGALGEGMDGPVHALALGDQGTLYAGGAFRRAGGRDANLVARWDGAQWHPLGEGITDGLWVEAMALDATGVLYVGGRFESAGGVSANHIAKWDGQQWSSVGGGVRLGGVVGGRFASVNDMVVDAKGRLYIGGSFAQVGDLAVRNVAMWDGNTWQALGDGMQFDGTDFVVNALALDGDGALYAAGVGGPSGAPVASAVVARWDGSRWTVLGDVMSGVAGNSDRMVGDLVVDSEGTLYLGGMLEPFSLGFWDGARWQSLGPRFLGFVRELAVDEAGHIYASGHFGHSLGDPFTGIAVWDGSGWSGLGQGLLDPGSQSRGGPIEVDEDGTLYLGGEFSLAGGLPANNIAIWSGRAVDAEKHPGLGLTFAIQGIHPNPTRGRASLSLHLAAAQPVRIVAYDLLGRAVGHVHEGWLPSGVHRLQWENAALPAGVYFLRAAGTHHSDVAQIVRVE